MNDKNQLSPAQRELEQALSGLQPMGTSIDRDRLMFLAGRRSVRRGYFWPGLTTVFAAAFVVSLAMQLPSGHIQYAKHPGLEGKPITLTVSESIAGDRETRSPSSSRPNYLDLRDKVLARGLDALPTINRFPETAENSPMTLQRLLGDTSNQPMRSNPWKIEYLFRWGAKS